MALREPHLALARAIGVAVGLIAGRVVFAQTVHPWGTSRCPPPGDTLSLLQASDPAYADAPAFAMFLVGVQWELRRALARRDQPL